MTLSETSVKLGVKETYKLTAQVTPSGSASKLRYKTSNKKIATVDSKTGKITAKKKGTATISATLDGKVMAKCKVTVKKAPGKVTLSKSKVTVKAGNTYKLKAKIPSGTYTSKYKWSSSNKKVATVDANGVVTGVKKGTAKITIKTGNGKKATCKVTVKGTAITASKNLMDYIGKGLKASASMLGWTTKGETSDSVLYSKGGCSIDGQGQLYFDTAKVNFVSISDNSEYNINGIKWGIQFQSALRQMEDTGWTLIEGENEGDTVTYTWGSQILEYDIYQYQKGKVGITVYGQAGKVVDISAYTIN